VIFLTFAQYTRISVAESPENTKSIKTIVGWGTLLGEFTSLPRTSSRPFPKPQPHSQHFGLPGSALWPKQLRAPKLLLLLLAMPLNVVKIKSNSGTIENLC